MVVRNIHVYINIACVSDVIYSSLFRKCAVCHRFSRALEAASLNNNNNNILYSSQLEIKAVIRSHNEEHISIILSHETHAHTHFLTYALSLNLHTLIANPELPGIMLSLSNQNVKTLSQKTRKQNLQT